MLRGKQETPTSATADISNRIRSRVVFYIAPSPKAFFTTTLSNGKRLAHQREPAPIQRYH